ncbi:MAG: D-aminoacyl-tRNA deacylase [Bacteroidales bacterium]|jgi:D-tyrosyl-tRNA(Tyr) deacylase|nr:D-aminoacyl-tRNA deacylase [Bacteroidales bacterium]
MRAVIQRVCKASVTIGGIVRSEIGPGLLVFAGIGEEDNLEDAEWLAGKIVNLRIFNDAGGVMNLSVLETGSSIMVISQFTLHAKTKKGNRPSYIRAAHPDKAIPIYDSFVRMISSLTGKETKTGEFGAMMEVSLVNDGPVTIIIDTRNKE